MISVRRGRALEVLPSLDGEEFDLVFLDADRAPLPTYLEWSLRLVRPGGMIVAHNALLGGRVANQVGRGDDEDVRPSGRSTPASPPSRRLTSILVPAYDGFVIAIVGDR